MNNHPSASLDDPGEQAIDPGLPIVDAHHHLADGHGKRYLLHEMLADTQRGHDIRATVFVESRSMFRKSGPEKFRPVGETEFANGVAAMSASGGYGPCQICAAIVSFADLRDGAGVDEVLEAHTAAGGGRFRGIRQASYWDEEEAYRKITSSVPPKGLLLDPAFREGFKRLVTRDLSFDAVMFHTQLGDLLDLARAFPNGLLILNHMGFPLGIGRFADRRAEVFRAWQASMTELAKCDNVVVKIGGMGVPFWGFGFYDAPVRASQEDLTNVSRPYVEETIRLFGPKRCMMESNFPPDRRSASYVRIWNALKIITRDHSADEKAALFYDTAKRVYRLTLDEGT